MHVLFANTGVQVVCIPLKGGARFTTAQIGYGWQRCRTGPHRLPYLAESLHLQRHHVTVDQPPRKCLRRGRIQMLDQRAGGHGAGSAPACRSLVPYGEAPHAR